MSTIKAKNIKQTVIGSTIQPLKIGGILDDGSDAKITIDTNGNTTLSQVTGIKFPATQNPSSDANTLDDYEEGTWTPRSGTNINVQNARYVKIGSMVYISGTLSHSGAITSYDNLYLPFVPRNSGGDRIYTGGCSFFENGTGTDSVNIRLWWQSNQGNWCFFWGQSSSGVMQWTKNISFDGTNGISVITFSLTYLTD